MTQLPQPLDYASIQRESHWSGWALTSGFSALAMLLAFAGAIAAGSEALAGIGALLGLLAGVTGIAGIIHTARAGKHGRGAAILGTLSGVLVLGVLFLLPTLGRAREGAQRIKCGSNLRQIGQALRAYLVDHNAYPPDFETLVANSDLVDEVLISPSSETAPGRPPYQLGKNCDFIYLAPGFGPDTPGHQIVVIEPVLHPAKDGQLPATHVLHADGSVHLLNEAQARQLLTAPLSPGRDLTAPATRPAAPPAPSRWP